MAAVAAHRVVAVAVVVAAAAVAQAAAVVAVVPALAVVAVPAREAGARKAPAVKVQDKAVRRPSRKVVVAAAVASRARQQRAMHRAVTAAPRATTTARA